MVLAQGWVKTRRDGKNVHFIQLNDGSSPVDLQVVLDAGVVPDDVVASISTGACLSVEGELVASPGKASPPQEPATNRAAAASMSFTTTRAPSAANRRASAAPMPLPAPVITTPAPATAFIGIRPLSSGSVRPQPGPGAG